ncbi:MAG: hypothetical protein R6X18_14830 [Chloroflexota bacterium]
MPRMVWIGMGDGSDATIFFDGFVSGEPELGAPPTPFASRPVPRHCFLPGDRLAGGLMN